MTNFSKSGSTNVMVFSNPEFGSVRTMTDENGEPLFCGKDVCDKLGYTKADVAIRQHVNRGDVTKRYVTKNIKNQYGESSKQKLVNMLFVNESGFYCLVFGSKLEMAQRFKHWVTSEVLPSIRKNGYYSLLQSKNRLITEQVARIWALEKDVDRMLPKELYVDNVLDSISCYFAHMGLAKSRTKSGVKTLDLQVPIGDAERSMKLGQVYTHTYLVWTERGRKFIHDLAKRMWDVAEFERLKLEVRVKCFNK